MTTMGALLLNIAYAIRAGFSGRALEEEQARLKEHLREQVARGQLDWPTGLLRWELVYEDPGQVGLEFLKFTRGIGQGMEVIFIDLNDFGLVNKEFDHDLVGNRVLSHLGTAFRESLRSCDLAFVQGDQMLVLSLGTSHVHTLARRLFQRWNELVDQDIALAACRTSDLPWKLPRPLTFAYGHQVLHAEETCDPLERIRWAIKEADARMKANKARFKAGGPLFSDERTAAEHRA